MVWVKSFFKKVKELLASDENCTSIILEVDEFSTSFLKKSVKTVKKFKKVIDG
jgi:hypothetical protein